MFVSSQAGVQFINLFNSLRARSSGLFFCLSRLQRSAGHPIYHRSHCTFYLTSPKRFPCAVSQPCIFFFSPNSMNPITKSSLEFTASNNCLMGPHVYTARHWHPDSVIKAAEQHGCLVVPAEAQWWYSGKQRAGPGPLHFSHRYCLTTLRKQTFGICYKWKCQLSGILLYQ